MAALLLSLLAIPHISQMSGHYLLKSALDGFDWGQRAVEKSYRLGNGLFPADEAKAAAWRNIRKRAEQEDGML